MYKLFVILMLSFSIVVPSINAATAGDRNYRNDRWERHDDRREWRRDRRERRERRMERRENRREMRRERRHERREWRRDRREDRREWRRERREWRRDRRERRRDHWRYRDHWSYYEQDDDSGAIAVGALMLGILGTAIILDGLNNENGPEAVEIPCKGMDAAREMERCPLGHTRILENR